MKLHRRLPLQGKKVLITAGPTREYWDPVRFISNGSSGRMGLALARAAVNLGAKVTVVLGPVALTAADQRGMGKIIPVTSALDMEQAVRQQLFKTTIFMGAAAVSDYRPEKIMRQKIKDKQSHVTLQLRRNPDIIAQVARRNAKRPRLVIGFALETQQVINHAQDKLKRKGLDWVVANTVHNIGNKKGSVTLIPKQGPLIRFGSMSKQKMAQKIWQTVLSQGSL